jgi:hypothetical protein
MSALLISYYHSKRDRTTTRGIACDAYSGEVPVLGVWD